VNHSHTIRLHHYWQKGRSPSPIHQTSSSTGLVRWHRRSVCTIRPRILPGARTPREAAGVILEVGDQSPARRDNSCPFCTTRCVRRRRTRPSPTRRTGRPHLWWLLQFESRAPPTLRFPERTRVALCSDLAHDNQQNSNFLFRLR